MRKRKSLGGRLFELLCFLLIIGLVASMLPVNNPIQGKSQHPNYPNGCEIVSLSMLLDYYGYDLEPGYLHDNYMVTTAIGQGDPLTSYLGDPRGEGFYSFQWPLRDAANSYLTDAGIAYKAKAPVVMPYLALAWKVHHGTPVIAWYTIDDNFPERVDQSMSWKSPFKRTVRPYKNLHVFVVHGMEGRNVLVTDPTYGEREIPLWEFLPRYYSMGARGVYMDPA